MSKVATIEILNNVRCKVHDMPAKAQKVVDDALAMEIPGAHFRPRKRRWDDGRKHLFYRSTCTFPKGLLHRVEQLMSEGGWAYEIRDSRRRVLKNPARRRVTPDMLRGVTLRPYQVKAAKRALRAGNGILWLATNAGKTEVACALMRVYLDKGRRILFVVHKRTLLSQAVERIEKRLGVIAETHIGQIGGGRFEVDKPITVAIINSLSRRDARWEEKKQLLKSVQVLFLDEGHHAKAATWYKTANLCTAQYRFILSGTPYGGGNGLMVEAAVGPVIARVSNEELIQLGVSAKPTIEMVEIDEPQITGGRMRAWDEVYKEGIVLNPTRNDVIARRAVEYAREGRPCLVIVKEIWHGQTLRDLVAAHNVSTEFVHAKMPLSFIEKCKAMFEAGKLDVLIASPIFDEGVDVPAIKSLIMADGGKSVRAVLQKIGRGLRKKAGVNEVRVLDFADLTHTWLSRHSLERIDIYQAEGFEFLDV